MRMIFVNLPVKDIPASRRFFGALGYAFNEQFSNESAACMVVDQNIFVMLLAHERFKDKWAKGILEWDTDIEPED